MFEAWSGLDCPHCGSHATEVQYSRPNADQTIVIALLRKHTGVDSVTDEIKEIPCRFRCELCWFRVSGNKGFMYNTNVMCRYYPVNECQHYMLFVRDQVTNIFHELESLSGLGKRLGRGVLPDLRRPICL